MDYIFLTILVLIDLIYYMILIDIVLSWLSLGWINARIKFIRDILEPIYDRIRNTIQTNIWPFDFTPIILVIFLVIIRGLIWYYNPEIILFYQNILKF